MAMNTTKPTIKLLKERGAYEAELVERTSRHSMNSHDLFGFADVLGVGPWGTIAIQATDHTSVSKRVNKLIELEATRSCLRAGWMVEVWGFRHKPTRSGETIKVRTIELEGDELSVIEASLFLEATTTPAS